MFLETLPKARLFQQGRKPMILILVETDGFIINFWNPCQKTGLPLKLLIWKPMTMMFQSVDI